MSESKKKQTRYGCSSILFFVIILFLGLGYLLFSQREPLDISRFVPSQLQAKISFLNVSTPEKVMSPPTLPILIEANKIVFLGDSITEAGTGEGGYIGLLQSYLKKLYLHRQFEIVNAGISGNKSIQMRRRFTRDVLSKNPDLLFINVGVNDVWHAFYDFEAQKQYPEGNLPAGNPLEQYQADLIEMVSLAREKNIQVILLAPTPIRENLNSHENQRLVDYIAIMEAIATANHCLFIDLNQPFQDIIKTYQKYAGTTQKILTYDGVHPNSSGHRVIAYTILKGLGIPEDRLQNLQIED